MASEFVTRGEMLAWLAFVWFAGVVTVAGVVVFFLCKLDEASTDE